MCSSTTTQYGRRFKSLSESKMRASSYGIFGRCRALLLGVQKNLVSTLYAEKCKFHMAKLVFMGLMLTNQGIGPTEEKVKAIVEAREPQNASEVRSFLGLANYNARFIPDFATVAEPLRRLTKKGVCFKFQFQFQFQFILFARCFTNFVIITVILKFWRGSSRGNHMGL